jgi:hypothetical protein
MSCRGSSCYHRLGTYTRLSVCCCARGSSCWPYPHGRGLNEVNKANGGRTSPVAFDLLVGECIAHSNLIWNGVQLGKTWLALSNWRGLLTFSFSWVALSQEGSTTIRIKTKAKRSVEKKPFRICWWLGLWTERCSCFSVCPFCHKAESHYYFQDCTSLLGGVKTMRIMMLLSDTPHKFSIELSVFDRWNC